MHPQKIFKCCFLTFLSRYIFWIYLSFSFIPLIPVLTNHFLGIFLSFPKLFCNIFIPISSVDSCSCFHVIPLYIHEFSSIHKFLEYYFILFLSFCFTHFLGLLSCNACWHPAIFDISKTSCSFWRFLCWSSFPVYSFSCSLVQI